MHVVFGANIELQGGHYGNAVLSRFPVAGHRNHLLPNLDNGEQRGVLIAEIELPGQPQPLRFMATHSDHRRADAERIASAEAINALAIEHPETATLLAGDLNDTPDSEILRTFGQQWASVNQQPLPTIPVGEP
ncbi:MAG: endonuclease/exonuclease/phosphatase family protein [Planctomycetaceae bacterium]